MLLQITQAAKYLGVPSDALRYWDKTGILKPAHTTSGGHRRYTLEQLDEERRTLDDLRALGKEETRRRLRMISSVIRHQEAVETPC